MIKVTCKRNFKTRNKLNCFISGIKYVDFVQIGLYRKWREECLHDTSISNFGIFKITEDLLELQIQILIK